MAWKNGELDLLKNKTSLNQVSWLFDKNHYYHKQDLQKSNQKQLNDKLIKFFESKHDIKITKNLGW